jgi:DENN domain-containing protein 5
MNHQIKRVTSKRVADFFVSVNAGDELVLTKESLQNTPDLLNWCFVANVVDRYPLIDRLNQPLPEGLPIFCFPNGVHLTEVEKNPTFHTFVHTSEGGSRMLGCCLTFYRKLNDSQKSSLATLMDDHGIDQTSVSINELFIPCTVCLISRWTFVSSFKKIMCNLYQISLAPGNIPIERYICNFIDDVPAPPAGRIDVTYYLGDEPISFRCPPANTPNIWSGMPLFPLFECLSPDNVLHLLSLVLIERQILFVSSQYSLLTICAEGITSLLFPITWAHAYIPILPKMIFGTFLLYDIIYHLFDLR